MKRAERQPETISVSIYAGVFIKLWSVRDAGTLIPQHSHEFPHDADHARQHSRLSR
jgi:hypothetical protein